MRKLRAKRKLGLRPLQGADVDEVGHTELLISAGFLPASESDDWIAVGKATARLLRSLQIAQLERSR